MPPPSRSSRRNQVRPTAKPTPADDAKQATEEIAPVAEPAAKVRTSQRQAVARTSQRSAVGSSRRSARGPASPSGRIKPEATPEELAARKAAFKQGLILTLVLAVVVGLGVAGFWLLNRGDPVKDAALAALADARGQLRSADALVYKSQPVEARQAVEAGRKALEQMPSDPRFSSDKEEAKKEAERIEGLIGQVELDLKVESRQRELIDRIGRLTDPAIDPEKLLADVQAFLLDPVGNASGQAGDEVKARYKTQIGGVQVAIPRVQSEIARRSKEATTGPLQITRNQVQGLMEQERFQEAIDLVVAKAAEFPQADFASVREWVADAAEKGWRSSRSQIDTRLADWRAPGVSEAQRQAALEEAKTRLKQVIERFGIPKYVDEAKAELAKLP